MLVSLSSISLTTAHVHNSVRSDSKNQGDPWSGLLIALIIWAVVIGGIVVFFQSQLRK